MDFPNLKIEKVEGATYMALDSKSGEARIQIPGVIANANKPEESALQFYHIQYDKSKGVLVLDFAGTEDYIVFNKDEVSKFGETLKKDGK